LPGEIKVIELNGKEISISSKKKTFFCISVISHIL